MFFSSKNIFPTCVKRGVYAFLVPRKAAILPHEVEIYAPGLHFYNIVQNKIVKLRNPLEIERAIYLTNKKLDIYIQGEIKHPEKLPVFITSGEKQMDNMLENRIDKLSNQIDNGSVIMDTLDSKLRASLQRYKEEWGIDFNKVTCTIQDRNDDDDNSNEYYKNIIYM